MMRRPELLVGVHRRLRTRTTPSRVSYNRSTFLVSFPVTVYHADGTEATWARLGDIARLTPPWKGPTV